MRNPSASRASWQQGLISQGLGLPRLGELRESCTHMEFEIVAGKRQDTQEILIWQPWERKYGDQDIAGRLTSREDPSMFRVVN